MKEKDRAYRLAQKERIIKKRLHLVKVKDTGTKFSDGTTLYENLAEKANKLADRHPYDCGKANCLCCHSEKVLKKKKVREQKLLEKAKQQLKEDL